MEYRSIYGAPVTLSLPSRGPSFFSPTPQSAFPVALPLPACVPHGAQSARLQEVIPPGDAAPPPLPANSSAEVSDYRERYGHHTMDQYADIAAYWFGEHLALYRAFGNATDASSLIDAMVAWAKAKSLTQNVQIAGNSGTVIYTMSTAMAPILNAYAALAPQMTAEQRSIVGPWINSFMIKLAGNTDPFRTQNHEAGWGLMIAEWGLATGDKVAVQHAINRYKMAIHDMRPDGSFAQDSTRGGSGLSYNNLMTGDLVLTAALLKTSLGLDLFAYSVDGRSISTAISYMLAVIKDPVPHNKKYALPCSASLKTVDDPIIDFGLDSTFAISAYMPAFALLNPDDPVSADVMAQFSEPTRQAIFHPALGAPPLCLFSIRAPGDNAVAERPAIEASELLWNSKDGPATDIDVDWQAHFDASVLGGGNAEFNIIGTYDPERRDMAQFHLVVNEPIGTSEPKALRECGAEPRTVKRDGGQLVVIIDFTKRDGLWVAENPECIAKAVPTNAAFAVRALSTAFDKLARDMVKSGGYTSVGNRRLQEWIQSIAAGNVKFGPPTTDKIPARIATREAISYNSGASLTFNSNWVSSVTGNEKYPEVSYNIMGTGGAGGGLSELKLMFSVPMGKTPPASLSRCGPEVSANKWDDQQYRLVVTLSHNGSTWSLTKADCVENAVAPEIAFDLAYLLTNFDQIARDMVETGTVDAVGNDHLRNWIKLVASGVDGVRSKV